MSGHSKWATTKHKKAVVDAKRGKLFAKLIKNVEVAARTGGGDPSGNPTLYDAIQKAKKSSVPNDNIDRAVRRGSGATFGVFCAGPGGGACIGSFRSHFSCLSSYGSREDGCAPSGRLWVHSSSCRFQPPPSALYRLTTARSWSRWV